MFMKLSNRNAFGHPLKFRSAFEAGLIDNYNTSDTKLYINNEIADSSRGQATPVSLTNTSVTLDGENNLVFNQSAWIYADQTPLQPTFALGQAWYVDAWINVSLSQTFNCVFVGNTINNSIGVRIEGDQAVTYYDDFIGGNNDLTSPGIFTVGTWRHIRYEKWYEGAQCKVSFYVDGVNTYNSDVTDKALYNDAGFSIGYSEDGGRRFNGLMNKIKVNHGAGTEGANFTPPERI